MFPLSEGKVMVHSEPPFRNANRVMSMSGTPGSDSNADSSCGGWTTRRSVGEREANEFHV